MAALKIFEGDRAESLITMLDQTVFCTKRDPYGKFRHALQELSAAGVDVGSGYWQPLMNSTKAEIIELTDPKKYY